MELREVVTWLLLASLVALLGLAALTDLRARRIPNWLTGGVAALYPVYVLVSPTPVAWLGALSAGAAVLVLGLPLFARQLIGGGDVKLIAAITLWAGLDQLALFALITGLTGGAMAIGCLWYRRWGGVIDAHLAALGWNFAPAGHAHQTEPAASKVGPSDASAGSGQTGTEQTVVTLPYGIAIAAGGLAVVAELMKL